MFHCTVKRSLKWVTSFKLFQVEIFHWILYQLNLLPQPKENKTSYFYAHENRVLWTKMTFLSFIHTHWKTSRSSKLNYVHTLWPHISHLGNTLSRNVFIYLSKEKRKNVHRSTVTPQSPHLENIQMPLSNRTNRRVVTQWKAPGWWWTHNCNRHPHKNAQQTPLSESGQTLECKMYRVHL